MVNEEGNNTSHNMILISDYDLVWCQWHWSKI